MPNHNTGQFRFFRVAVAHSRKTEARSHLPAQKRPSPCWSLASRLSRPARSVPERAPAAEQFRRDDGKRRSAAHSPAEQRWLAPLRVPEGRARPRGRPLHRDPHAAPAALRDAAPRPLSLVSLHHAVLQLLLPGVHGPGLFREGKRS